jgi:3D (Asp-Asp-Asp) domain-containing protein
MSQLLSYAISPFVIITIAFCLIPEPLNDIAPRDLAQGVPLLEMNDSSSAEAAKWRKIQLVATAYNSVEAQTDSTPDIAAWGDKLEPGMKSIAVSRDLLKMGLKHGSRVWVEGLQGEHIVLDKMNKRWKKRIDVYMGEDVSAALNFGRRDVVLHFRPDEPLLVADNI